MSLGAYNVLAKPLASPFESSSSFSFDGTDDFITSDANQTLATQTFSFWLKNSDTSERQTIFTHGLHYRGAFHINWDLSEDHGPIIYFDNNSYKIFSDAACPQQDDGQWHHYLVAVDSAAVENSRLWIDSVEITSVVSTNTGAGGAFNSGIRFGKSADQTWYYGGSIDEFAIFTGLQTDTDFIRRIYNDGRPTNLVSESNLAHWFRMGEGKLNDKSDGDSNILFQGLPTTFGSELVTSGDFSSSSGWNLDSNASVSGGKLVLASSTGLSYQTIDLEDGHAYEVSFTVENFSSGNVKAYLNGTNGTVRSANGTYTEVIIAGSSNTLAGINPSGTMDLDNFSIKKLTNSGRISGAAVIPDEGAQLLTGFTNGSSYPFNTFTSSGRDITAAIETSGDYAGGASNQISIVDETTYKVTFNLTYNSGSDTLRVVLADNANGAATLRSNAYYTTTNGVNVAYLTATATDSTAHLQIGTWHESDLINFSATNITLQEVTNGVPLQVQNLAPISRGEKAISLDGTDDVVDLGASSTFFSTNVNSISMWFKMPDTSGGAERIFVSNSDAGSSDLRVVVSTSGIISVDIWNGSSLVSTTGGSAIDDDIWHHLVYTTSASAQALYIDGVSVATTTHTRSSRAGSVSATIAAHVASAIYSDVDVSDVAIYDVVLPASAAKAIYNAGQSTHLTVNTGAYTYKDNLQAYYKMGSATVPDADGTTNLLFDQRDPGLEAELFPSNPSASDWAQLSSFDWDGSTLSVTDSSGTPIASYSLSLPVGSTYLMSFDVTNDGIGNLYARIGDGTNSFAQGSVTSGSYEVIHTVTSSGHNGNMMFISNNGFSGSVTNISVREVKGNTATITSASVVDNNVPRQIYALPPLDNTKSVTLDGTNDHLVTQVDATAQLDNESRYYSWWSKSSDSGAQYIFDHGDFTRGGFGFNISSGRPLLYMSSSVFRYFAANTLCDDGTWHNWVVRIKYNDITGCELWCDGVKQGVDTTNNSGSMNTYTTGIRIGRAGTGYFEGNIEEFCIWGEVSNPDEFARALFNAGRPIDPSKSLGAANQPELLRHWWRMGDASHDGNADGTNDILFQGVQYLGDELIENGTYDSDTSGWTASDGATLTVVDGKLRITTSAAYKYAYQSFPTEVGAKYLFSVTGTKGTSPNYDAYFGNSKNSSTLLYPGTKGAADSQGDSVIITDTFTATATTTFITLRSRNEGSIANAFTDFDDVTVKQLRGQYLGPELVTNGDFSSGTNGADNWTTGAGFTISGGKATRVIGQNSDLSQTLSTALVSGSLYKISFNAEDTSGNTTFAVRLKTPGEVESSFETRGASNAIFLTASNAHTVLDIRPGGSATGGAVSNISVKEVVGAAVMTNMDPGSDIQTDTPY